MIVVTTPTGQIGGDVLPLFSSDQNVSLPVCETLKGGA